jgi:two-component system phosphate regulon response regulator OmpR
MKNQPEQVQKIDLIIIEDEIDIAQSLSQFLASENIMVRTFPDAESFYKNIDLKQFKGLYIIDWNLPGEKGVQIITKIRAVDKFSSIFMLSAYNREDEIITGLKTGADDYITKPFSYNELLIRVQNALKKLNNLKNDFSNGIKLLEEASALIRDGETVNLTSREFIIVKTLFNQINNPVTRDKLIAQFDSSMEMTERNIDVHVFSLRRKIKKVHMIIDTVWGLGYKLILE